jgi:hypothetical protein
MPFLGRGPAADPSTPGSMRIVLFVVVGAELENIGPTGILQAGRPTQV